MPLFCFIITHHIMKRIFTIIVSLTVAFASAAQTDGHQYKYFRKGFYLGVDASAGAVVNDRISMQSRNLTYGIDMAAGYRFRPQLVVAAGFGGHAYTSLAATVSGGPLRTSYTTSVPVFLRLRSDFLDRKVSPYAQLDLGYSFVFLYSRDAGQKIKYNDKVFMDRVEAMGFSSLEDYEAFFRTSLPQESADALWDAELSRLKQFTNGSREYIAMDGVHMQYGRKGLFASLDLGVSWSAGERHRMNAGISAGLSQAFYGTCLRTVDNRFLHFGRVDGLPREGDGDRVSVMTLGQPDFIESFELDVKLKLGFTF